MERGAVAFVPLNGQNSLFCGSPTSAQRAMISWVVRLDIMAIVVGWFGLPELCCSGCLDFVGVSWAVGFKFVVGNRGCGDPCHYALGPIELGVVLLDVKLCGSMFFGSQLGIMVSKVVALFVDDGSDALVNVVLFGMALDFGDGDGVL